MTSPLTRRRFLTLGGGTALWLASGCSGSDNSSPDLALPPPAATTNPGATKATLAPSVGTASDNILVVVQLMGGNDGLNTLIPDSGAYMDARSALAISDSERIVLAGLDGYSLHPALSPLASHWEGGTLALAAGVAFDEQDRSHFEARDLWWRAKDGASTEGWLARWMNETLAPYPDREVEGFALGFGPRALSGSPAPAVSNPSALSVDAPAGLDQLAYEEFLLASAQSVPGESPLLAGARSSAPALLSANRILADIADPYSADAYTGKATPSLDYQLATTASLIGSRPNLRVVTVGVEGFDTHADQLAKHDQLLAEAAGAISDFWESLGPADQDRTTVLTISEFGRRVAPNDSAGTDHGRGGMQMLLGGGVIGGQLIGDFDLGDLDNGDLPMRVSEIEVYADALRWLGGPVSDVLGVDPPPTGLLRV